MFAYWLVFLNRFIGNSHQSAKHFMANVLKDTFCGDLQVKFMQEYKKGEGEFFNAMKAEDPDTANKRAQTKDLIERLDLTIRRFS